MPITFEQSKDEIARRVKQYLTNRAQYRATAYKEAHARQEFIDPLFIALGWDVHNSQRLAPDYRVDLKADPAPAYQLRRYAWSGKLLLSILTDFEELAVYDCRSRPSPKDKASVGRIYYFTCEEYAASLPLAASLPTSFALARSSASK